MVRDWRLPRVLAGLVFGAALGVAGAIFQNITRNPMGSPDVIGLDAGAYTGALVAITVLSGTSDAARRRSVLGGLVVAAVDLPAVARTGLSGLRLVVIGIAINAMRDGGQLVDRAARRAGGGDRRRRLERRFAQRRRWGGPVRSRSRSSPYCWSVMATRAHAMHQASLGDAVAATTGVGLDRLRLLMVLVGVGCTATVTAVAGPIAFIALAAPQIGRRLAGAAGVPLLPAALTGAVLLLGADLIAQMLLAPGRAARSAWSAPRSAVAI